MIRGRMTGQLPTRRIGDASIEIRLFLSEHFKRDYRVGEVKNPSIQLAAAVGASSAFPPVLSPMIMKLDPAKLASGQAGKLKLFGYDNTPVAGARLAHIREAFTGTELSASIPVDCG